MKRCGCDCVSASDWLLPVRVRRPSDRSHGEETFAAQRVGFAQLRPNGRGSLSGPTRSNDRSCEARSGAIDPQQPFAALQSCPADSGAQARRRRVRHRRPEGRRHLLARRHRSSERDRPAGHFDALRNEHGRHAHQRSARGQLARGVDHLACGLIAGEREHGARPTSIALTLRMTPREKLPGRLPQAPFRSDPAEPLRSPRRLAKELAGDDGPGSTGRAP